MQNTALDPTLKISTFSVTFRGTDRAESAATGGGVRYSHCRKADKRLCLKVVHLKSAKNQFNIFPSNTLDFQDNSAPFKSELKVLYPCSCVLFCGRIFST